VDKREISQVRGFFSREGPSLTDWGENVRNSISERRKEKERLFSGENSDCTDKASTIILRERTKAEGKSGL